MKKITAADREWAETVANQSLDDNEVETLVHEFNDWLDQDSSSNGYYGTGVEFEEVTQS